MYVVRRKGGEAAGLVHGRSHTGARSGGRSMVLKGQHGPIRINAVLKPIKVSPRELPATKVSVTPCSNLLRRPLLLCASSLSTDTRAPRVAAHCPPCRRKSTAFNGSPCGGSVYVGGVKLSGHWSMVDHTGAAGGGRSMVLSDKQILLGQTLIVGD